jgi:excinuclease ABC subunit C
MRILKGGVKIRLNKKNMGRIPATTGVYLFVGGNNVLYIGKSVNLKARVSSHLESAKLDPYEKAIISNSDFLWYIVADSELKALLLETKLIRTFQPKYNRICKDDKSFLYVKITAKDDYPKVFQVRRENDNRSVYFGPFGNVREVEEILAEIRKVFPYCSQKKIGKRSCFYSKINLCSPCPNMIEATENQNMKRRLKRQYRKNIRRIVKVLEGDTDIVLKTLYSELKILTKKQAYEQALSLRNKIYRFERFTKNSLLLSEKFINYNQADDSLESLIKLISKYIPNAKAASRIECYDISNTALKDSAGSMVVFTNGLVDKSQYRRFKIRGKNNRSDFDMMTEVVARRFKQDWPQPDLIVIDGGKPQMRRIMHLLTHLNINIPVLGIAKHPDRLVVGTNDLMTIKPSVNHLGFNLIRYIRDESHRFARKYHLVLRGGKLLV